MVTISDEDAFVCTSLVYARWSDEYDLLKKVKAEKPDGTKDWQAFHNERLRRHTKEEEKWCKLRDRLVAAIPKSVL